MFISKQELNEIRTAIKNLQAAVKAQEKKNKTYDASLKNRHSFFASTAAPAPLSPAPKITILFIFLSHL